jgi:hypothetical protein
VRPPVAHVAPSWPGVVRWELGTEGVGRWRFGGVGALVPFLDFRDPDSDFRKHRRAMTGVAEPGGAQRDTRLEPQQRGGHLQAPSRAFVVGGTAARAHSGAGAARNRNHRGCAITT